MKHQYKSWGYNPDARQEGLAPAWRTAVTFGADKTHLPFGNGRSYGDSCLNSNGTLMDSRHLNHVIEFDKENGTITCESGILFSEIINICAPEGWFLPVSPGTRFITVGGAIANDVHGKNHHKQGTFGCHVIRFEILRTDGSRLLCSLDENSDLFRATIGGLGLTGMILWAQFSLIPIVSRFMKVDSIEFSNLDEFYKLSSEYQDRYEYSVAWLDCAATGTGFGRGIFLGGNHVDVPDDTLKSISLKLPSLKVPIDFPNFVLSPFVVRSFNSLYYQKNRRAKQQAIVPLENYFYPLDNIGGWNRIYGKNGFLQYQFTLPLAMKSHLADILRLITDSQSASFLAVLKEFGNVQSPGMLSYPSPGYCLALDFPNKGTRTLDLLKNLNDIVLNARGCVYPAKDRLMSAESFKQYYPEHVEFLNMIDSGMSSDFWRRVMDHD